jgi:nitrate/nitrite transporter NarK
MVRPGRGRHPHREPSRRRRPLIPTALLPTLLKSTLRAPAAAALGIIEGVSDALAGVARLVGGTLADDPQRRRTVAVGAYTTTAVLVWSACSGRIGTTFMPAPAHPDR